jgi:estrone sulfotransferase
MTNIFRKITKNLSGLKNLKTNDSLLVSYPKSGNTWVRFYLCNLLFLIEEIKVDVDFKKLDETMPELGASDLSKEWLYKFPRIVKTHKSKWFCFDKYKSILVVRDPRDVMVSYFYYLNKSKQKNAKVPSVFSEFIRSKKYGLIPWFEFYNHWLKHPDLTVIYYEDMLDETLETFSRFNKILDIDVSDEFIYEAILLSSSEKIKELQKKDNYLEKDKNFKADFKFLRSGKKSQWVDKFSKEDLDYYESLCEKYVSSSFRYKGRENA